MSKLFKNKWIKYSVIAFVVLFIIAGISGGNDDKQPTTDQSQETIQATQYEVVVNEDNGNVQNIDALLLSAETSEDSVTSVVTEIKENECNKRCNISLFDDKEALELDVEYRTLTDGDEMTAWKAEHYDFVADHLLGYMMVDNETVDYYPYK